MIRAFLLLSTLLLFAVYDVHAQKSNTPFYSISGQVVNAETGEPVALASFVVNNTIGVVTDQKGAFKLNKLKGGPITYNVSFLGYSPVERKLVLSADIKDLRIALTPLSLGLEEVVVTAQPTGAGSTSKIGEEAIRHIQPMSIGDMFQLLPGNLSVNPNLNGVGQAAIREIGSNANNALGAAVIVDGAPLSNDGNLQALSPSLAGSASNQSQNGMSDQTTAGKGVDLRSVSPDNVESMEVIRGIPSVEYGNLTSGVVIVKTKTARRPGRPNSRPTPIRKWCTPARDSRSKTAARSMLASTGRSRSATHASVTWATTASPRRWVIRGVSTWRDAPCSCASTARSTRTSTTAKPTRRCRSRAAPSKTKTSAHV